MKKFKVMLSVFMVIIIILVSIIPVFAVNKVSTHQAIINEDLSNVMKNSESDEKIKVYLWYKDIDQNEVDALTTEATGLTPEKCAVIEEFPSVELISSLKDGDASAKTQMNEYIKRSKPSRDEERNRTKKYSKKHLEISNEKYNQKSRNIKDSLSISDNDVEFSSQFAPLIIAEMTKEEIEKASVNINIEEIGLSYDYKNIIPENCTETYIENPTYTDKGDLAKKSIHLNDSFYNAFGLTGAGVDVGLVEVDLPGPYVESGADLGFQFSDITVIQTPNSIITPGIDVNSPAHGHPNNTIRVMAHEQYGIASDINIYASNFYMDNLEALLKGTDDIIDVLEVNYIYRIKNRNYISPKDPLSQTVPNSEFAYHYLEKYYDHIVAEHNIITVVASGNTYEEVNDYFDVYSGEWKAGARVGSPGLAYNVITVGGYYTGEEETTDDDILRDYLWRNSYLNSEEGKNYYGCEKPDVVMPINFYYGGTSESSPALTAQIALMLELKPSLSLHPELMKAIVLASCHRKANHTAQTGAQEIMTQGITERQGAGIPDAWAMASIICQGSYGYGSFTGFSEVINFVQPTYGATGLNISVTWIRDNKDLIPDTAYGDAGDIQAGVAKDVNLLVYQNDAVVNTSTLENSSAEMCYFNELSSDYKYKIELKQNNTPTKIRYAYAWSTNNMYAPISTSVDSIKYIKNLSSGKYLTFDKESSTPECMLTEITSQSDYSEANYWILKQNNDSYNIATACGTSELYFGIGTNLNGTMLDSQISSVAQNINLQYNEDGTVSFLNSIEDRILTLSSGELVWKAYDKTSDTPSLRQKWYLETVNYLCGDANMDGVLEVGEQFEFNGEIMNLPGADQSFIQNYINNPTILSNLQFFLSDVDKDGVISIMDATMVGSLIVNKYI